MQYDYSVIFNFISTIFSKIKVGQHNGRVKAIVELLRGMLYTKEAKLSGMGRGATLLDESKTFTGQLKRAYRLIKNENWNSWDVGCALYKYMTSEMKDVIISVDWTQIGLFMVLEASIVVKGRGIPFYGISVLSEDIKGRQSAIELSMLYALSAMRQEGQTLYVISDRGFAKMDWLGESELYPYIHQLVRLKGNMILDWDGIVGQLREWPLYPGEIVGIEKAIIGRRRHVMTGICLAHLGSDNEKPIFVACASGDVHIAEVLYQKRVWLEEQNRDLKTNFSMKLLRLTKADRIERIFTMMGLAFFITYCNEGALSSSFAKRMGRQYKDGRTDLSWVSQAKYSEMAGNFGLLLKPILLQ